MTKEELKKYDELNDKFIIDCERVAKVMEEYNSNYHYVRRYDLVEGEVYAQVDEYDDEYEVFPAELLTYTDGELEAYAFKLDQKRREEEEKEAKRKEKIQAEKDLEEYKRLKEKLGL